MCVVYVYIYNVCIYVYVYICMCIYNVCVHIYIYLYIIVYAKVDTWVLYKCMKGPISAETDGNIGFFKKLKK